MMVLAEKQQLLQQTMGSQIPPHAHAPLVTNKGVGCLAVPAQAGFALQLAFILLGPHHQTRLSAPQAWCGDGGLALRAVVQLLCIVLSLTSWVTKGVPGPTAVPQMSEAVVGHPSCSSSSLSRHLRAPQPNPLYQSPPKRFCVQF